MEESLIEVHKMHRFAGIEMITDLVLDRAILTYRRLLEKHKREEEMCETVKSHLNTRGMTMRKDTILIIP
jgi:IS5 family transposase